MKYLFALLVSLAACSPTHKEATPTSRRSDIITHCDSSAQCKGESNGCVYCYNGQCSCTLPAEPVPVHDAGVGASK